MHLRADRAVPQLRLARTSRTLVGVTVMAEIIKSQAGAFLHSNPV